MNCPYCSPCINRLTLKSMRWLLALQRDTQPCRDSWHVRAYICTYVYCTPCIQRSTGLGHSIKMYTHTRKALVPRHMLLYIRDHGVSDIWNMSYVGPLDSCSCAPHVHVYVDNYWCIIALPDTQYTCSTLHTAFEYSHRMWPVLTDVPCKDHHAHCSVVLDWWRSTGIHFDSCWLSFVCTGFNPPITCGGTAPTAVDS